MSLTLKRFFSLFLVFCLVFGMMSVAVFATPLQNSEKYQNGKYHYTCNEEGNGGTKHLEGEFIWSDSWFLTDGREMNSHLASLSAVASIASAGYISEDENDTAEESFDKRDAHVKEFLTTMGFENYESNKYYHINRLTNSAGCAVAHKTIFDDNGAPSTLLVILPMSAEYRNEWAGNFTVGDAIDDNGNGLHTGFKSAADEILRFTKQYVSNHSITGNIKVWTAGHSRGSALANILGAFFAAGSEEYFENALTVEPENIYCYTFATPGTVAGFAMKSQLLSVEGARSGDYSGKDTLGAPYTYSGTDGKLLPDDGIFSCIHNCRANYDLITLLPPYIGWNFTVFGKTDLPIGDSKYKDAMLKHLKEEYPDVYKEFIKNTNISGLDTGSNGDADVYEFKKIHFQGILPQIVSDGDYSMSQMLDSRIDGLRAIMPDRKTYVEKYQETFSAALGIYGMAWKEFSDLIDSSVAMPMVLNYLAYVSGRLQSEKNISEQEADIRATIELIMGIYAYISEKDLDYDDSDSATVRNLTEDIGEQILALVMFLDPETASQYEVGQLHQFLLSKDFESFYRLLIEKIPQDKQGIARAIFEDDNHSLNGGKTIRQVVTTLLPELLKDGDNSLSISNVADAELAIVISELRDKTLSAYANTEHTEELYDTILINHFNTIRDNPESVRDILFNLICRSDSTYRFSDEIRTIVTFIVQASKVGFAHYNELYVAWMRAADTALVVSDIESGETDKVSPALMSAAQEIYYTTDGTLPTADDTLYQGSIVFPEPGENESAVYTVVAVPYQSGVQAGPAKSVGIYTYTRAPESETITENSVTVTGVDGQEYVIAKEYVLPDWSQSITPDNDRKVVFAGLEPNTKYTVYTRIKSADLQINGTEKTLGITTLKHLDTIAGSLIPGATVSIQLASSEVPFYTVWNKAQDGEGVPVSYDYVAMQMGPNLTIGKELVGSRLYVMAYNAYFGALGEAVSTVIDYASVTFETNGGSESETIGELCYGDKIERPEDPTRYGNIFEGWYSDKDFNELYDFDCAITGSLTLYAKWTPIEYKGTEGGRIDWKTDSSDDLVITVKRSIDDENCFAHYVETLIDQTVIPVDAKQGSTIVTISSEILKQLDKGVHTVTVKFDDGEYKLDLSISAPPAPSETGTKETEQTVKQSTENKQSKTSPKTGDSGVDVLVLLTLLSAVSLAVLVFRIKKKRVS